MNKIFFFIATLLLCSACTPRRIRDTGQFSRTTGWNDGFASQYGRWSDIGHGYDSRRQI